MSHKMLRPFIVNVSVLCYFPLWTPCVIIRTPYIQLDKLYIIDESIRKLTITLFIINFMKNVF